MTTAEHFARIDKYVRRDGIAEAMESLTALRTTFSEMEQGDGVVYFTRLLHERCLELEAQIEEMVHYKEQRLRAHALIDKIMEAVDAAGIGDRASEWDVLDSSVRQLVAERAALTTELEGKRVALDQAWQKIGEIRTEHTGVQRADWEQIKVLTIERDQARELAAAFQSSLVVEQRDNGLMRRRSASLEEALRHYAERNNWNCRRCGGSEDLNCGMLFWKGPIGMEDDDAYGHGWSIARAALSSTTQSEPEPEPKPGSPLHPHPSVESTANRERWRHHWRNPITGERGYSAPMDKSTVLAWCARIEKKYPNLEHRMEAVGGTSTADSSSPKDGAEETKGLPGEPK